MILDLAVEALVATLLAVTIGYCFVLNRRLARLRADQNALADLITSLNQATARAEEGVFQLRSVSQSAEESLKSEIARARALSDELALITEAGSNLADRIEAGLSEARGGRTQPARPTRKVEQFPTEEASGDDDDIRQAIRAAR
ncbi:MAG: chemotaxis protein [Alphaproteobacteria bacterium]|nr:MAG: chemotaxis protein [Alphaproteobacteria bacterium]